MKKARLVKKAELAHEAPRQQDTTTQSRLTQNTVKQWLEARQHLRPQNPRAAFAALFAAQV